MPHRVGLTLEEWPNADRAAWQLAMSRVSIFDTNSVAGGWRPKTCDQARYAYARWLTYVRDHDPEVLNAPLAERVTPARMRAYVELTSQRISTMSVAAELQHLLLALRALAPCANWAWLRQWQSAYQKRARPRDKRPRIVDPRRLIALGIELMGSAASVARQGEQARQFRDGLLIALLAMRPLRRKSLAALELGQNVHFVGARWVIELAEGDTKSGRTVEIDVPDTLTDHFALYLKSYRPLFPHAADETALWLSSKGGVLTADAIYNMVCRRTESAFGFAIHPHLFRDIAVTAIAREAPGVFPVARDLLAHANLETTQHFYSRALTVDAARRHAATIARLRAR